MTSSTLELPATVTSACEFTASLAVSPPRAEVGETVVITGSGYPPNEMVELVWYTVRGRYELLGGTEFVGQTYDDYVGILGAARADDAGGIRAPVIVPRDFGGPHDVRGRVNGRELSQASL